MGIERPEPPRTWTFPLVTWLVSLAAFGAFLHVHDQRAGERLVALTTEVGKLRVEVSNLAAMPPPSCGPSFVQAPVDADALARRTAEALRAMPAASGSDPAAAPAVSAPTPEQTATLDHANEIADAAFARGRLGRADVLQIRRDLAGASPEDAQKLRLRIAAGLNAGQIKADDPRTALP